MANLTFKSNGTTTVCLSAVGKPFTNSFLANDSAYTMGSGITLADQDTVTFEGTNQYLSRNSENYYKFIISGDGTVEVSGDLASLTNNVQDVKDYQYIYLFKGCDKITSIEHLNFPTGIADFAYSNTFAGCTGLTNAGTTLPASFASRWSYNGMFAYCTNLTVAPNIAATKSTSFSFYNMFVGCTSLTDGPKLYSNPRGKMNSNCMFKDCSNLSTIQVAYTDWPAGADQNESKNWLKGVSNTGLLVHPNTLTIPTGVIPDSWDLSAYYPATIVVDNITVELDAMLDQVQTSALAYSYLSGEYTLSISIDDTNKPAWLSTATDSDSINFSANGYDINSSTSFQIPITLSAADAETKNVTATFNITNWPTNPITVNTIPTFSFDAESETDIISSLQDYVTYNGNTLSCEIIGTLPAGITANNGVLSGVPGSFTDNFNGSFDVVYSAQDSRNVSSSFDLEIVNAAPDYSTMPLTFLNDSDDDVLVYLAKNGNAASLNLEYSYNGTNWNTLGYGSSNGILLTGHTSACVSGNNNAISDGSDERQNVFKTSGAIGLKVYGNVNSLVNFGTGRYSYYKLFSESQQLVDAENLIFPSKKVGMRAFIFIFNNCPNLSAAPKDIEVQGFDNDSKYCFYCAFNTCPKLVKAPYIHATTVNTNTYQGAFANCTSLKVAPLLAAVTVNGTGSVFESYVENCSSLSAMEVVFTSWPTGDSTTYKWVSGVGSTGIFIKPSGLTISRGTNRIPSNWTVLNRHSNGTLWYVNENNQETGTQYTGEDPYAWHYNQ